MQSYILTCAYNFWWVKLTVAIILGAAAGAIFALLGAYVVHCPRTADCSTHPRCEGCVHLN
jgi:membrane associated rhomboid family serine protease